MGPNRQVLRGWWARKEKKGIFVVALLNHWFGGDGDVCEVQSEAWSRHGTSVSQCCAPLSWWRLLSENSCRKNGRSTFVFHTYFSFWAGIQPPALQSMDAPLHSLKSYVKLYKTTGLRSSFIQASVPCVHFDFRGYLTSRTASISLNTSVLLNRYSLPGCAQSLCSAGGLKVPEKVISLVRCEPTYSFQVINILERSKNVLNIMISFV